MEKVANTRLMLILATLSLTACSALQDQLSSMMGNGASNTPRSQTYPVERDIHKKHPEHQNTSAQQMAPTNVDVNTMQTSPGMENTNAMQPPALDNTNANPNINTNPTPASQSQTINLAPSTVPQSKPIEAPPEPVPSNQTLNPNKKDPLKLDMNKMMQPLGATSATPVVD